MFIKHKNQKEIVNLSLCTNYYSHNFKPLSNHLPDAKEDYRIIFQGYCIIIVWAFMSSIERDEALEEIEKLIKTTEIITK